MQMIFDFFKRIYDYVLSLFAFCYEWILGIIQSSLDSLLSAVADAIPDLSSYWSSLQVIQPYTAFVNQWVALDTALVLIGAYFAFVAVMIPTKLIIKLFIPTVG